ncbi:hypothetical protein GCM10018773_64720 [Streptomyces candidus]|nr:hypothetical protein GCM10018773_64720 [Streptomyces candidus]
MDSLTLITGEGQQVGKGEEFAPLAVMARAGGEPAGGQMVSFYVDDPQGTGTDFQGGSPVMITTSSNGTGSTDVALVAGASPGTVQIKVIADGAHTDFPLEIV